MASEEASVAEAVIVVEEEVEEEVAEALEAAEVAEEESVLRRHPRLSSHMRDSQEFTSMKVKTSVL